MDDIDLWALALAAAVAFVAAVVGGLTGFGVGLVLPAFIAPIVGIEGVVPTMAFGMTITNLSRVVVYRRSIDWPKVAIVLATAAPAAGLGAFIYTRLPADAIAIVLGGFLVSSVFLRRWLARRRFVGGWRTMAGIGAAYGGMSGAVSGAGIVLIAGLLAAGLSGGGLVATDAAASVVVNVIRSSTYAVNGLLTAERMAVGVLIGAMTVPAAFVARWLMDRLSLAAHTAIMEGLIVCGGLSLLWQALR